MGRRLPPLLLALALVATGCSYEPRSVLPPIPVNAQSSTIYASDGSLITTFHAEENRKAVPLSRVPGLLRDAVIAIEDERFYQHSGVDLRAVLRAARTNAEAGEIEQGGSTITQQYVKTALIDDHARTIERKLEEAALALQLEREYSKDRILELYLNTIYFGNGAYGVDAAARQYFGRPVGELTLDQAALLAGLIQRPGATDPYRAPESALARRQLVLERMVRNGFVDQATADAAAAAPLQLASQVLPAAELYPAAYFVETVKQWILDDQRFGDTPQARRDLLFGGGLKIQTTVDLGMQAHSEQAVAAVLPDPATSPAASLVSIEPTTGYVRAMVGGRDFFGPGENDKLNLATQGPRQAGSSFKPFVLTSALEQGLDPATALPAPACTDLPMPQAPPWHVCNYGGGDGGVVDLVEGTVRSYNTLFAQLIVRVGPAEAMDVARRMGITSELRTNPAAVLGTNEVTALEMASAYGTFANRGVRVAPVFVTRITRADGTVLYEHRHEQDKVLDVGIADTVTSILQQVIERGTGTAARLDRPAAGKTGTEDDWSDAWFVGYTPELATAVWIGFPGAQVPMAPPRTPFRITGGSWPAEIWRGFMSAALAGRPARAFPAPPTTTTTVAAPTVAPPTTAAPALVAVPGVVGSTIEDATAVLAQAGLGVRRVPGGPGRPGTVTGQSPGAGTPAPAGSTVTLEVSGKET